MRILHITSGVPSLSNLDYNMTRAYEMINRESKYKIKVLTYTKRNIPTLLAKIKQFNPDYVIVFRVSLASSLLSALKQLHIPVGRWVVDDPHRIDKHLARSKQYDFVITQEASCVPVYERHHIKGIHGPLATNENEYYPMEVSDHYSSDICFIGTPYKNRLTIIDSLADLLKDKKTVIIGPNWNQLKYFSALQRNIKNQTIPPHEVAKYYNGAKIVLNLNRPINDVGFNSNKVKATTPNNRTFDIAACQSFQLTACLKGVETFYEPNSEIICFQNRHELKEQISYYLEHPTERNEIADRAYQRTLRDHTYKVRIESILEQLQSINKK
ncbi:glycosyltransferase [Bacillus sp. JCM 19034]|uniref:CgeB family protein n=1 Tax=Bacillus sp. JCM 19034 TaxID=1481928 RepID=UPI0007830B60|nr:glycosyltransferase [Bacillus sp. JCM 19034]